MPKLAVLFALILFLVQVGLTMFGVQQSFSLGVVCWLLITGLCIYVVWVWERTADFTFRGKLLSSIVVAVLILILIWSPARTQYRREHPAFATQLETQVNKPDESGPRNELKTPPTPPPLGSSKGGATIKPKTALDIIHEFLHTRTVPFVDPDQWDEFSQRWAFMVGHMGDTHPALNLEINGWDVKRGITSTRLLVKGMNINPEPGAYHIAHDLFWWKPDEHNELGLAFKIDDSDGSFMQEVYIQKDETNPKGRPGWLFASTVTDLRKGELLLGCKDPRIQIENWASPMLPECVGGIGLFRINAILPNEMAKYRAEGHPKQQRITPLPTQQMATQKETPVFPGKRPKHSKPMLKAEEIPPKEPPSIPPPQQRISAPNGIAIGGGTVTNPTVNNFVALNRRLNQQQTIALKASARIICSMLPPISVTASDGNQEAQRYALDFVSALKDGGCKAELYLPIPGLTPDVSGVLVGVRDMNNIGPVAQALKQILSHGGIKFSVVPMKPDFFPDEQSVFVIGARE